MSNNLQVQNVSKMTTFLTSDAVKGKINSIVGDKKDGARFISTIVSAIQQNPQLANCDRGSIVNCGLLAHTLNLEPSPQLGYFYLVPFKNNRTGQSVATPVIGYKGYIQLALRTGQYLKINAVEVKRGEYKGRDRLSEEIFFEWVEDDGEREKLPTVGYVGYFKLNNGFEKTIYWSKEKMEHHARKYSKAYSYDLKAGKKNSFWSQNYDEQAKKTMLRRLFKFGPVTTEIETALKRDTSIVNEKDEIEYVDNESSFNNKEESQNETVETITEEQQDNLLAKIKEKKLDPYKFLNEENNIENIKYLTTDEYENLMKELDKK